MSQDYQVLCCPGWWRWIIICLLSSYYLYLLNIIIYVADWQWRLLVEIVNCLDFTVSSLFIQLCICICKSCDPPGRIHQVVTLLVAFTKLWPSWSHSPSCDPPGCIRQVVTLLVAFTKLWPYWSHSPKGWNAVTLPSAGPSPGRQDIVMRSCTGQTSWQL